jgi:hypothetical protein
VLQRQKQSEKSPSSVTLQIQLRLPRWRFTTWLSVALVATTLSAAAVYAKVTWTPFVGGEKLTSAKLNANFMALADAVEALQAAPPVLQPHLVIDKGNVDVGVYLGTFPGINGQNGYLVYSPAVKAPLYVNAAPITIAFDALNCSGKAYLDRPILASGPSFSNLAFNTGTGNIYQVSGPSPGKVGVLSFLDGGPGQQPTCRMAPVILDAGIPIKDTKVANLTETDVSKMSVKLQ